ncbi:PD-(D/E)XK nuclease family protein [Chitinophaga sp. Cy-1792]|uniref:PDDEXK-like family protein n=1 Tax=Chitinophaga sp. Cy-1792 TaxID=2608339 RepID=UPI00141F5B1C|nr:PD-(D/E)XK nuclease family protein [Chitinophaga sp. Cy-1792]NIG56815.1 hypothetical protein [Chitinophaga sp. Cy-1792]
MKKLLLQSMLRHIHLIDSKYQEIARITGENFNIFKILRLETKEVRLHSSLLAELLNPKGSHGKGDVFLKLLLSSLNVRNFDTEGAEVFVEDFAGHINSDYTEGGRIDILIKPKKGPEIIIENKIHAEDAKNQLVRYKAHYRNARIYYLTLNGDHPSKDSVGNLELEKDFFLLSYRSNILEWLELCQKEATALPSIREVISQYVFLLKFLTGQSPTTTMENEILSIIGSNEENIMSSFDIVNSMSGLKAQLMKKLKEDIIGSMADLIKEYPDLEFFISENLGMKDSEIAFWEKKWGNNHREKYSISFYFDGVYKSFFIGVYWNPELGSLELKNQLFNALNTFKTGKGALSNWAWLHYYSGAYGSWDNQSEPWIHIFNGKMRQVIIEELKQVLVLVKNVLAKHS